MTIIKQHGKRSGLTYAYEATYYWDKEKKQSRTAYVLIGRVDEKTGEIVPTDGKNKKDKPATKRGPKSFEETKRLYYGATYLLESFANKLGLTSDLQSSLSRHL